MNHEDAEKAARKRGFRQEQSEHPSLPKKVVCQLVDDHIEKYGSRAYPKKQR